MRKQVIFHVVLLGEYRSVKLIIRCMNPVYFHEWSVASRRNGNIGKFG